MSEMTQPSLTDACYPYYPYYTDYDAPTRGSTNIYTTHSSSSESDTIPLGCDESGYDEHFHQSIFDGDWSTYL